MSVDAAVLEDVSRLRAPGIFRTAVRMAGSNWTAGSVSFVLPDGETVRLTGQNPGPDARLMIKDFRCLRRALMSGDIGFAEGYMAGEWDTPDLAALLGALRDEPHVAEKACYAISQLAEGYGGSEGGGVFDFAYVAEFGGPRVGRVYKTGPLGSGH